jgi:hypothetical protein
MPKHPHCAFGPEHKFTFGGFEVIPLPFLDDNLAYVIKDTETMEYVLVDAADMDFIQAALP